MRAAVFHDRQVIRVEDVPAPAPGPGEALVAVAAAGICGSDLHVYRRHERWRPPSDLPYRAGHEFAGVVRAVGEGVDRGLLGRRVAVEPVHLAGCGRCRWCRQGAYHVCPRRGLDAAAARRRSMGFAELDVAPASHVFPIPDSLSFEVAALADVYACAVHAVHRVPVGPADAVAVIGTGPVGLSLGQVARASGARRTIVVGRRDAVLELALAVGAADAVVNSSRGRDPGAAVAELTGGEGADVVFETVGESGEGTLAHALAVVARGGRVGILGSFSGQVAVAHREANAKEIDLRWSNSYSTWNGVREFRIALDMIAEGRVQAAPLITHRYPLGRIAEAFGAAADRAASGAVKVIVEPELGAAAGEAA